MNIVQLSRDVIFRVDIGPECQSESKVSSLLIHLETLSKSRVCT